MISTERISVFLRKHFSKPKSFLLQTLLFFGFYAFLELFFRVTENIEFSGRFVYPILFSIPASFLLAGLFSFFSGRVNCILSTVAAAATAIWFGTQIVYSSVFMTYMETSKITMAGDVADGFGGEMVDAIVANIPKIVALALITAVFSLVMFVYIRPKKRTPVLCGSAVVICVVVHLLCKASLLAGGEGQYSPAEMYKQYPRILDNNIENFGVMTSLRLEISDLIFPRADADKPGFVTDNNNPNILKPKPPVTNNTTGSDDTAVPPSIGTDTNGNTTGGETQPPQIPVKTQNIIDINYDALIKKETNKDLLAIHKYVASQEGSYTNKYTGMFEGYNLIMICAESFSDRMISPELTPTLYKMQNNGFVFNNYYGMFKSITTNGEYAFCTGLIPNTVGSASELKSNSTFDLSADKYLPYCMGNVFESFGASTFAYHGNKQSFYRRGTTHPNMGYDLVRFLDGSVVNGVFMKNQNKLVYSEGTIRPTSDSETAIQSLNDYLSIKDENGKVKQFTAYYMTYSGHHPYYDIYVDDGTLKNPQTFHNRDKVDHLNYNEVVKSYLACNLEVENMVTEILKGLEAAGCLENTVIVLTNDHYPYGLGEGSNSNFSKFAGKKVDTNFGIYENAFICYNAGMEKPVVVDTPCCTVDIIPTLLNLFGVDYDSRLLAGTDVLDENSFHIAMLYNQSFVTDMIKYNTKNGKVTYLVDKDQVSKEYIDACINYVKNKFEISLQVIKKDYYKVIYDYIEEQ